MLIKSFIINSYKKYYINNNINNNNNIIYFIRNILNYKTIESLELILN